jgi:hypothetical protein
LSAVVRAAFGLTRPCRFARSDRAIRKRRSGGNSKRRRISGMALRRFEFLGSLPKYGLGDHGAAMS